MLVSLPKCGAVRFYLTRGAVGILAMVANYICPLEKHFSASKNTETLETGTCTSCGGPVLDITTTDQLVGVPSPNISFNPYTGSDNCKYVNVSCTGYQYASVTASVVIGDGSFVVGQV